MSLITISRGIGCGGMIVARLVADGLKVALFDDEKLQAEAGRLGYGTDDIKEFDAKAPGFFDQILSNKPEVYLNYLEALIYDIAKKGEGVIIGHGSQMLLRDFECALHVHIYAGEARRVENLVKHQGVNEAAALRMIHKSDHEQKGFFRFAFHMDWTEPSLYDLIINTEQLGIDTAAHLIMEAARSEHIKSCSVTAGDAMERLALKKKIDAALLAAEVKATWIHIEVPHKGEVQVSGFAHFTDEKARIINTIKAVKGVSRVEGNIGIARGVR